MGHTISKNTPNTYCAVTIVVPIYGDLPSILGCIKSLLMSVDLDEHRVMLVNDVGPDADAIELAILEAIVGQPSFSYFRNDHNLGFVGTCNRAALELDDSGNDILLLNSDTVTTPGFVEEMRDVLNSHPRHGVVTARSNSATIASMPYRLADPLAERSFERTRTAFSLLSEHLPRFTIAPVAMGFCFLTRRSLIDKFGLFDDVFAPGYGEENDYCLRINQAGYLALIANRALVLHEGSKSFSQVGRNEIRDAHEVLLERRYPFYRRAVRLYNYYGVSAVEWFADVITPRVAKCKVSVDIRGLSAVISDEERNVTIVRQIIEQVVVPLQSCFDVELLADADLIARIGIDPATIRITTALKDPVQISDVGIIFADSTTPQRLTEANRRYLHWGVLSVTPARDLVWSTQMKEAPRLLAETDLRRHAEFEVALRGAGADAFGFLGLEIAAAPGVQLSIGGNVAPAELANRVAAAIETLQALPELLPGLDARWQHFTRLEHYLATAASAASAASATAIVQTHVGADSTISPDGHRSRVVRAIARRLTSVRRRRGVRL